MLALGLTKEQIRTRALRAQIRRLYRGVYTTAPETLPPLARETAVLLACRDHAVLSHLTALNLWRVFPNPVRTNSVHVLVNIEYTTGRGLQGVTVHRTSSLPRGQVRRHEQLLVTSPERTLLDCALLLEPRRLEKALDESLARHLTSLTKLREMLDGHRHAPGSKRLGTLVDGRSRPTVTIEEMEERFLMLIRQAGFPEPLTQVRVYEQDLDFYWPDARFAVELDSRSWHMIPSKFDNDRRKDQILRDHGIAVARSTWNQITEHPFEIVGHVGFQLGLAARSAA